MTIWVINAALSRNVPWLSGKVPLLIPIHIVPLTESPVNIHSWAVLLWEDYQELRYGYQKILECYTSKSLKYFLRNTLNFSSLTGKLVSLFSSPF